MKLKKIKKYLRKHYLIALVLFGVLFAVGFSSVRSIIREPTYIYVKIKVGQGLWWAATSRPNIWIANGIQRGEITYGQFGNPKAEILRVRRYPTGFSSQYDVYVTLKLAATYNEKNGEYNYDRSILSIGSPIAVQFTTINLTGSVMELSPRPFEEKYEDRIIYLVNKGGYATDFTYRYDSIQAGDKYYDGEETVFEVLEKSLEKNILVEGNDITSTFYEGEISSNQNIVVKARIKVQKRADYLLYGEENIVNANAFIPIATHNYLFENFNVRKIE